MGPPPNARRSEAMYIHGIRVWDGMVFHATADEYLPGRWRVIVTSAVEDSCRNCGQYRTLPCLESASEAFLFGHQMLAEIAAGYRGGSGLGVRV